MRCDPAVLGLTGSVQQENKHKDSSFDADLTITALLRLEKTFKIKSNCNPDAAKPSCCSKEREMPKKLMARGEVSLVSW